MPLDCDDEEVGRLDPESDPDHIAKEDEEELISDFCAASVASGEVDREEAVEDG